MLKRKHSVSKKRINFVFCTNNFIDERNRRSTSCINHGNFTVPIYAGIRAANPPIGAFDRETNNPRGIPEELLASHGCTGCTCRVFQRGEKSRGFCKFKNFTLQRVALRRVRGVPRQIPSEMPDRWLFLADWSSSSIRRGSDSLPRRHEGRARLGCRWCRCNLRPRRSSTPPDPHRRRAAVSVLPFASSSVAGVIPWARYTARGLTGSRKNHLVLWKDRTKLQVRSKREQTCSLRVPTLNSCPKYYF